MILILEMEINFIFKGFIKLNKIQAVSFLVIFVNNQVKLVIPFKKGFCYLEHYFFKSNDNNENSVPFEVFGLMQYEINKLKELGLNFNFLELNDCFKFYGFASDLTSFNFSDVGLNGEVISFKTELIEKEIDIFKE